MVTLVLLFGWAGLAYAEKDVRTLYGEANAAFAVGEFSQAADLYQQAYKLKQDPALLYDAAQSYRLAGNSERALVLYKNYLMFHPHQRNADEVRAQIAKLKDAVAAQDKAKTAPPMSTVQPAEGDSAEAASPKSADLVPAAARVPSVAADPAPVSASALVVSTPPMDRPTPIYKKWWLWTAVGAVVVGAVVVGVVVGTRSTSPWNTAPPIGPGRGQAVLSW